jgi:hypothetical protein
MRMLMTVFGMSCLLLADEASKQKTQVVHTERVDFPAGRLLRFKNSIGVTVEGWDRPDMEIATIKSTRAEYPSRDREKGAHKLDQVRISVERRGEEIMITTDFPRHRSCRPRSCGQPPILMWSTTSRSP